ncbi:unnamed protein product, partial [Rotaria socialis]
SRCINCGGDHISGHSACPVVQEKRHALAEQSKRQRSELLIRAERQRQRHQYHFQGSDYPALLNDNQSYLSTEIPHQAAESSQKFNQRERSSPKNIEYTLSSFLNKMERRLDEFSSRLSLHLCDIDKKINVYYDCQVEMENILHETILPTIQELARVVSQSSRNRNTQEDFEKLNKKIKEILVNQKHQLNYHNKNLASDHANYIESNVSSQ